MGSETLVNECVRSGSGLNSSDWIQRAGGDWWFRVGLPGLSANRLGIMKNKITEIYRLLHRQG